MSTIAYVDGSLWDKKVSKKHTGQVKREVEDVKENAQCYHPNELYRAVTQSSPAPGRLTVSFSLSLSLSLRYLCFSIRALSLLRSLAPSSSIPPRPLAHLYITLGEHWSGPRESDMHEIVRGPYRLLRRSTTCQNELLFHDRPFLGILLPKMRFEIFILNINLFFIDKF